MKSACALVALVWFAAGVPLPAERAGKTDLQKAAAPGDAARVRGFSVTLVLGEMQGAATPDNLPPGAKKALDDMRSFLPYKSFRLLDTQWILCCASGIDPESAAAAVAGRLRGVDEQEYHFSVTILNVSGPQLSVRFLMSPASSVLKKLSQEASEARGIQRAALERQLIEARQELEQIQQQAVRQKLPEDVMAGRVMNVEQLERQLTELMRANGGKGAVIDSTFSMDIGETVVIGTSSLKGEKALIALLTAAPRPGGVSGK
jgi:hypothetical protein